MNLLTYNQAMNFIQGSVKRVWNLINLIIVYIQKLKILIYILHQNLFNKYQFSK